MLDVGVSYIASMNAVRIHVAGAGSLVLTKEFIQEAPASNVLYAIQEAFPMLGGKDLDTIHGKLYPPKHLMHEYSIGFKISKELLNDDAYMMTATKAKSLLDQFNKHYKNIFVSGPIPGYEGGYAHEPRTIYLVDIGEGMLVPRDFINEIILAGSRDEVPEPAEDIYSIP